MIEVNILYVLGGLIMLPSTTFLVTRLYYTKMIHHYEKRLWVYENINNSIDTTKLINEVESTIDDFKTKQKIITKFLEEGRTVYNEVSQKSNLVSELKNKFENN